MTNHYFFALAAVILSTPLFNAQGQTYTQNFTPESKIKQDRVAIKSMQGCYDVSFNFAETFSYSDDSLYTPSEVKQVGALEWIELLEDEPDRISMQHLLIVNANAQQGQQIVKHWRQDWLYENTDIYHFDHNNRWKYTSLPSENVKGQWTQRVYEVDDSPRYEGSATWVHVDGRSSWENTTDAPLPRREYTTRNDYNVTVRTNHIIADQGRWIHDQDNDKVIRKEGASDILLAQEKGRNVYIKIDDKKCHDAQNWWTEHHTKWDEIRAEWDRKLKKKEDLDLSGEYEILER
ncbi:MAG: hypothetical protein OXE92_09990 [Bacteroidetes bacterium]|nr:hypothetical protein [Bacteroidota bacterium]MCY4206038.1 hypothetical protein [Bacteroidota bacterium]